MAIISEQSIEQVRQTADVVEVISSYVSLKQKGRDFKGLCPFHTEKTPSFSVSPQRQIYKCFGCGKGGGVINFIMDIENIQFPDAVKHLANKYDITLEISGGDNKKTLSLKSELLEIHQLASDYYKNHLKSSSGKEAINYLNKRGISEDLINEFEIGLSPDSYDDLLLMLREKSFSSEAMKSCGLFVDSKKGYINRFRSRIMFPIHNANSDIIAFGGRIFNKDDPAKYLNSPETPIYIKSKVLYGLHQNAKNIKESNQIILLEGYMDLIQLYKGGINNCLATCGTASTNFHATTMKRLSNNIFIIFDGDDAGQKASISCGYTLIENGLNPKIITPPNEMDPDDWITEKGANEILNYMQNASNTISTHYNYYFKSKDKDTQNINLFINQVIDELMQISDTINLELNIKTLSELTSIDYNNITHVLNKKIIQKNKYKKNNQENQPVEYSSINEKFSIQLHNDLVRLCFSEKQEIRKFIANNLDVSWLQSIHHKEIYNQIFIHLTSETHPQVDIIVERLQNEKHREILTDLVFDLHKFKPSIKMAIDCLIRFEVSYLTIELDRLRTKLKEDDENIELVKRIVELEQKIIATKNKYNE